MEKNGFSRPGAFGLKVMLAYNCSYLNCCTGSGERRISPVLLKPGLSEDTAPTMAQYYGKTSYWDERYTK